MEQKNGSPKPQAGGCVRPDPAFRREVAALHDRGADRCYQCRKCTNGCPLHFAMDLSPNTVMRMVQLGMAGDVLTSRTIWVCASCQTCTTRCPNDIDIAGLMDTLRQTARARGIPCPEPRIAAFHDALLKSIRRHGKVFELEMTLGYKLATGDLMGDAGLGWEMFKRGKLRFFPSRVGDMKGVRKIFDKKED